MKQNNLFKLLYENSIKKNHFSFMMDLIDNVTSKDIDDEQNLFKKLSKKTIEAKFYGYSLITNKEANFLLNNYDNNSALWFFKDLLINSKSENLSNLKKMIIEEKITTKKDFDIELLPKYVNELLLTLLNNIKKQRQNKLKKNSSCNILDFDETKIYLKNFSLNSIKNKKIIKALISIVENFISSIFQLQESLK